MKLPLLALALTLATLRTLPSDGGKAEVEEHGRLDVQRFYEGEVGALWDEFDDTLRTTLGSREGFEAYRNKALDQLGHELEVVSEEVVAVGSGWTYVRVANFEKVPKPIQVILAYDAEGRTTGFLIRPVPTEAPSRFLDYHTKTALHLPFEGEWTVFWGGRALKQNYHAAYPDQRFAYDFLATVEGATHTGEGTRNEDYHCFGRPVLAPAAGTVVVAVDGVEDNVPGVMNPAQAAGNHVILDHGNGEYSFLAHFKKGTLAVQPGQDVAAGTRLGVCGNSGNSSEPHLHYHLQNTAVFGKAEGLPAPFLDYLADGATVESGEPVKGQRIAPR